MTPVRLDAGGTTLVLDACSDSLLLAYFGRRLPAKLDLAELARFTESLTPYGELDRRLLPLLLPTEDGVSTQRPALRLRRGGRRMDSTLQLSALQQLAGRVHATLEDERAGMALQLVIDGCDSGVYRWQLRLTNAGHEALVIDELASISLPLLTGCAELQRCTGFWANELQAERQSIGHSVLSIESLRGRSSHQSSPTALIGSRHFSDECGTVLLAALEWSGNHRLTVAPSPAGGHQLLAGCAFDRDYIELAPGASWDAPPALLALSTVGINGLRTQTRRYWHTRKRPPGAAQPRPVHFNSWEAAWFDHDAQRTLGLLEAAADLGAERFVLDDGWMQGRSESGAGLGDWTPCPQRYPDGLAPIAARARALGMGFGLWIEPEMVTLDSALARQHPDWVITGRDRPAVTGRHQYLLDLELPAVHDYLHTRLSQLIETAQPDYLKWDMNRDLADLDGRSAIAFTRAWYALLERLRKTFPDIEIEACAAGGARADCGALAHCDRIWPSDSMDPLQRFRLLRTVTPALPSHWLGAHVGAATSATAGTGLPLSSRCAVALLGNFGMELDPASLNAGERDALRRWVTRYKDARDWLATADTHFLDDPAPGTEAVLMLSSSGVDALLLILQTGYPRSGQPPLLRLSVLDHERCYRLELANPEDCDFSQQRPDWQTGGDREVSGATLALAGLRAPFLRYGHCALIRLRRID